MRIFLLSVGLMTVFLTACVYDIVDDEKGHKGLKPRYEKGTPIIYQDGNHSRDLRNHQYRPEIRGLNEKKHIN